MAIWFVLNELLERGGENDLQGHPKKPSKLLDIGSVDKRRKIPPGTPLPLDWG